MMTMISTGSPILFGTAGLAPASPQSARGESVNVVGLRTELVAASQANAPLYDQRAQLTDTQVTARTAAGELAARQGEIPRPPEATQRSAPLAPGQLLARQAELAPHQRVQHGNDTTPHSQDHQQERSRMQQRAMQAYAAPQTAPVGEYFSMSI